jgi:predicted DCC family thiol-disulfide oxidoreductase YuxK
MALIRRLDRSGRICLVDLTDGNQACPLDRRMMLERLHAREGDALYSGAAAFAALWRAIPLLRPFGELARVAPVLWVLERAYRGFLRLRPRIQRWLR